MALDVLPSTLLTIAWPARLAQQDRVRLDAPRFAQHDLGDAAKADARFRADAAPGQVPDQRIQVRARDGFLAGVAPAQHVQQHQLGIAAVLDRARKLRFANCAIDRHQDAHTAILSASARRARPQSDGPATWPLDGLRARQPGQVDALLRYQPIVRSVLQIIGSGRALTMIRACLSRLAAHSVSS